MGLAAEFENLEHLTSQLVGLLLEVDETFWHKYLERAIPKLKRYELAGATYILGCFSGEGSFSDLTIANRADNADPLQQINLSARLNQLRTAVFKSAKRIASRQLW
jgi:hypothetical protein